MAEQLSWDEWRAKAKQTYKKGVYTSADMVRDWGYPEGVDPAKFRMIFRSGEPGKKSREAINTGKAKSNRGRTVKETYSTDLAGAERRAQDKRFQPVLNEASLFALNNKEFATMVEHGTALNISDVVDSPDASGDPTNRYLQPVTEGIKKTDAENYLKSQGLEKDFVVMDDEQTGGRRIVSTKTANTFQFPSEQGQPFENLDDLRAKIDDLKTRALKLTQQGARFASGLKDISQQAVDVKAQRMMDPQKRMPIDPKLMGPGGLAKQAVKEIAEEAISVGLQSLVNQVTRVPNKPRFKK